jgi:hypothetical protein
MSNVSTNSKDGELVGWDAAAVTSEVISDSMRNLPADIRSKAIIVGGAGARRLHEGLLITNARTGPDVTLRDVC